MGIICPKFKRLDYSGKRSAQRGKMGIGMPNIKVHGHGSVKPWARNGGLFLSMPRAIIGSLAPHATGD